jgi:uncharacterized repeat protein (TIGR02543 family)
MKRFLSLFLAVAMLLALVAVPATVANPDPITITLLPAENTPYQLNPGDTFTMELHLDNPANRSIGSISELVIEFDPNVLEWNLQGDYQYGVNMPFAGGNTGLTLNPPWWLNTPGFARFNFDSHANFTGGGLLMSLNFRAKSSVAVDALDFTMSVLDIFTFFGVSMVEGTDYVLVYGGSFETFGAAFEPFSFTLYSTDELVLLEPTYTAQQINSIFGLNEPEIMGRPDVAANFFFGGEGDGSADLMRVTYNGKVGLADLTGRVVLPAIYDEIERLFGSWYMVTTDNVMTYINTTSSTHFDPVEYEYIGIFSEGFASMQKGGLWGFVNESGEVAIPLEYDGVGVFSDGLAAVQKDEKWGYINTSGTVVIPITLDFDLVKEFAGGIAIVKKDGKFGAINTFGNIVVPVTYDAASPVDGLVRVLSGDWYIGRWTWFNASGNVIVPATYDFAQTEGNGIIRVRLGDKYGFLSTSGAVIAPAIYDEATVSDHGLIQVRLGDKWGFYNNSGVVIPAEFEYVSIDAHGLIRVHSGQTGKWGLYNESGTIFVPVEYDFIGEFNEGLALVQQDGKYGFINTSGTVAIPLEYDMAGQFSEGLAAVSKDGLWGYINTSGDYILPISLEYDFAGEFYRGGARVQKDGKWGLINVLGTVVIPLIYDDILVEGNASLIRVRVGDKWGIYSLWGFYALPIEYDIIEGFYEGFARVQKDGKWGLVNKHGTLVLPPTYHDIGYFTNGYAWIMDANNLYGIIGKDLTPLWGDVNGDGRVDSTDVFLLRRWIAADPSGRAAIEQANPGFNIAAAHVFGGNADPGNAEAEEISRWIAAVEKFPLGPQAIVSASGGVTVTMTETKAVTELQLIPFSFQYLYENDEGYVCQLVHEPGTLDNVDLAWFHISSYDPEYDIGDCSDVFTILEGVGYRYSIGHYMGNGYRRYNGGLEIMLLPGKEPYLYVDCFGYQDIEYEISEKTGIQPFSNSTSPPSAPIVHDTFANRIIFNHINPPSTAWATQYHRRTPPAAFPTDWLSNRGEFTGLTAMTGYRARARFTANNAATHLHSNPGNESITITTSPNRPSTPTVSTSSPPTASRITVNAIAAPTVSGWSVQYQIRRSNGVWPSSWESNGGVFRDLDPSTDYRVRAKFTPNNSSTHGHSEPSLESSIIRTAAAATVPTAPQNFTATPGNANVALSWTAPTSGSPFTRFEVSSNNGSTWVTASSNTSHTFSSLTNGQSYTFRVRAVNSAGNGTQSSAVSATPRTTPGAPQSFTATPGNGQVSLTWSAPSSNGGSAITGYQVSRDNVTWITPTTTTSHTFSSLANGTSYTFRVRAVNVAGNGTQATVNATPVAPNTAPTITTQPVNQTVTAGSNATFTVAASGTPTPTFQWQENLNGTWTNISGATGSTLTRTAVTTAMNGRLYRAVASNSQGTATSISAMLTVNASFTVSPTTTWRPDSSLRTSQVITVTAPVGTPWLAFPRIEDTGWLSITNVNSPTGPGTFQMRVIVNPNTTPRTGVININSGGVTRATITVIQDGRTVTTRSVTYSPGNLPARVTVTSGMPSPLTYMVTNGASHTVIDARPIRSDGATFLGWDRTQTATTPEFPRDAANNRFVVNGNTTLFAIWQRPNRVTITWNANGGTPIQQTSSHTPNAIIGRLPTNPTRPGFTFIGWFSSSGTRITSASIAPNVPTSYSARWITWDANGGSSVSVTNTVLVPGAPFGTLPTPTWAGHRFDGWFTHQFSGREILLSDNVPNISTTYWARWTESLGTLSRWHSNASHIGRWPANAHPAAVHARKLNSNPDFIFQQSLQHGLNQWNSALNRNTALTMIATPPSPSTAIVFWGGERHEIIEEDVFPGVPLWIPGEVYYDTTFDYEKHGAYSVREGTWHFNNSPRIGYQHIRVRGYIVDMELSGNQQLMVSTHELGHAFGWRGHLSEENRVMSGVANSTTTLTPEEINHLRQIYP